MVALIVILFDGGMHVGWRRLRGSIGPIAWLGVPGTFATAGLIALFGHWALGFSWTTAGLIGAAIAPTDPAVMFSVLANRQVGGRSGTILEGESGANDPVGIALMLGLIALATTTTATGWTVAGDFVLEMVVGLAFGVAAGLALGAAMRRVSLPNDALYPLQTLAAAGVVYGLASVAHGSGFLAVFVAGIVVGDVRAPYKGEIRRFHGSLASIGEISVFVALGLTVNLDQVFSDNRWLEGLAIAAVISFVVRPIVVGGLLLAHAAAARREAVHRVERPQGRGADPAPAFALLEHVDDGARIYDIVFIVVLFSVLVQGTGVSRVAAACGVPMRAIEPEPWSVSIRLRSEPHDLRRFVVADGSRAAGHALSVIPFSDSGWVSLIIRDGEPDSPRGSTVLEPGDQVIVVADPPDHEKLQRLFEG